MKQKPLKKRLYLAVVGRRYLSKAAAVHCTAAAELSQVTKYLKKDNGLVARLPIDLSPYETLPGPEYALRAFPQLDPTVPKILYLSRLHPMKRPDLLLESAALVRESQQRFQMVLAGPGDPKYLSFLHDLVRRLHLENNVVFTGLVTGKIKVSLYQTARAFVLPTWQENFGYVYFEALASGTPVITTRGADMWRDLEQAGATVVEPDASKIASALAGLIASPDQAKLIGDAGRRWVFETFGTKKAFDDLIRIYDDVIQRSAA